MLDKFLLIIAFTYLVSVDGVLKIGNRDARPNEAPFMAYIEGGLFCGGTILTDRIILTSAHCNECDVTGCLVSVGSIYIDDFEHKDPNRKVLKTVKVLQHENYHLSAGGVQSFNDIALMMLNESLDFSHDYLKPIAGFGEVNYREKGIVYGWGAETVEGYDRVYQLKTKEVKLIVDEECAPMYQHAIIKNVKQEYEICSDLAVCRGDSGSPMIQIRDGVPAIIGISTWTTDDIYNCSTAPHVYTDVAYFAEWIKKGIATLTPDVKDNFI